MVKRRHISRRMRNLVFEDAGGICTFCKEAIARDVQRWEVSHDIPLELGGADDRTNMRPAHYDCHRTQTAKVDIPRIAKAKRVEAKHNGTFRPPRHVVPGSKASPWKKLLSGKVVRRDGKSH